MFIRQSIKTGFSFGITSGIITTLGLMVGLYAGTDSTLVVVGGILFIAVADSLSDALGIHVSEESRKSHTTRQIWEAAFSTLISKFLIALSFIIPVVFLPLNFAVIISVIWGILLTTIFSYFIAKEEKEKPYKVILEHLLITVVVVVVTYFIGEWVKTLY